MELEQLHLDLLDLRQLYCLMQTCFSGQQNARVEILGGRARLLFKSLLDDATSKVFMAYSKMVETQLTNAKQTRGSTENKNAPESDWFRIYETEKKSGTTGNEKSSSPNSFVSCHSTSHEATGYDLHSQRDKKRLDTAIYPEDISDIIEKIESHILSFKLRSRSRNHTLENGLGRPSGAMSFTKAIPNQGLILRSDIGRSESVSRASQLHGCEQEVKRKATVGRIESLSQSANQASFPEVFNGSVVPSVAEDAGLKVLNGKTVRSHPTHYGSAPDRSRAKEEELRKNMPLKPTLLDHPTSELMQLPTLIKNPTDGATKRNGQMSRVVSRKKMNLQMEEETEKSQSSNSASSSPSWATTGSSSISSTSQQSGARSSDNSEYSSPRHYVDPVDLHRLKPSPTKRHQPDSHKGSEKMIGGLKRLKKKFGLILHHHHYHHNGEDGQLTKVDRRHSIWKHLGKPFHNAHQTRPVKSYNKSRVQKAPSEHQEGHFHALAEGFMRHIWKSGRSKQSKGKIGGLRRQKKSVKWCKLPNKAKGFANTKRQLKFA